MTAGTKCQTTKPMTPFAGGAGSWLAGLVAGAKATAGGGNSDAAAKASITPPAEVNAAHFRQRGMRPVADFGFFIVYSPIN
jgi:hypothetical protein